MGKENKAVITAALASARTSKEQNPVVPCGASEIIEEGEFSLLEGVRGFDLTI